MAARASKQPSEVKKNITMRSPTEAFLVFTMKDLNGLRRSILISQMAIFAYNLPQQFSPKNCSHS